MSGNGGELTPRSAEFDFLGEEFLTWLWFRSEVSGGRFELDGEVVEVVFQRFILLEGAGPGSGARSSLISRGPEADLSDAKAGLALGKKVVKAHLALGSGRLKWHFTLAGRGLLFSSMRLPETEAGEGDLDHAGLVMERMGLLEQAVELIQRLFHSFMELRLDRRRWEAEKRGLRQWLSGQ